MRQIFHIFRKDVRHHWIEVLSSLAILTAYAWQILWHWGEPEPLAGLMSVAQKVLMALVPASWCWLVIRSIQDESLVGDRQFWLTRPYDWRLLAGAKFLFAVVFVHLPLFVAQVVILHNAGYSAIHYVEGLLWIQMLVLLAATLTAAVAGVVTSSIVQVLILLVAVALYGFGMAALSEVIPNSYLPSATANSDYWSIGIPAAVALVIIVIQFGWRKTWVARSAIGGIALLGVLAMVSGPYMSSVADIYPLPGKGERPAVLLEVRARDAADVRKVEVPSGEKKVSLSFEMAATDVTDGTVANLDGTVVTIQVPNGPHWSSNWEGRYWHFWPGGGVTSIPVDVDRKFYEKNQNTLVNVHFTLAITGYRLTNTREVMATEGEFPVAGVGMCWLAKNGFGSDRVGCRSPFREPSFVARSDSSESTCVPGPGDDPSLHESLYSFAVNDSDPADLAIVPVKFFTFYFSEPFSRRAESSGREYPLGVCAGTPFKISQVEIFQHTRIEEELDGIRLSDYAVPERPFRFSVR